MTPSTPLPFSTARPRPHPGAHPQPLGNRPAPTWARATMRVVDDDLPALAVLRRCSPFQDVAEADVAALLPAFRRHRVEAGGYVWHQGDPASSLWFLLDGQVHSVHLTPAGEQLVTQVVGPGESFGEPALFLPDGVRIVSVVALVPSVLLSLAREPLLRFLETHPAALRRMLESLSRMVLSQSLLSSRVAFSGVAGRVGYELLKLADEYGSPGPTGIRIPFRLSQTTLAGLVASSRESVNRALTHLSARGLVRQDGGYLVVVDPAALRAALVPDATPG